MVYRPLNYHNEIIKQRRAERYLVDQYREEIISKQGTIYLTDYFNSIFPDRFIEVKKHASDTTDIFLQPIIKKCNKFLSIQQAFYELMCEGKLMPVSSQPLNSRIVIKYVVEDKHSTTKSDCDIDFQVLPYSSFIRVN